MKGLRLGFVFAFVVSVAVALNVALLRETFFIWQVLVPLGVAFLCGAAWLTVKLTTDLGVLNQDRDLRRINTVAASMVVLGICIALYALTGRINRSWDLSLEGRGSVEFFEYGGELQERCGRAPGDELIGRLVDAEAQGSDPARSRAEHLGKRGDERPAR